MKMIARFESYGKTYVAQETEDEATLFCGEKKKLVGNDTDHLVRLIRAIYGDACADKVADKIS